MATTHQNSGIGSDADWDDSRRDHMRTPTDNPDPITGAPGSHPVGTGVGAASGGVAGAAAGAAIGSVVPGIGTVVGGAIGAVVGATGGGLAGKGVAEGINPTAEDAYWRQNFTTRPYYTPGASYDEYSSAYRYGWESRSRYPGRSYDEVEADLGRGWDSARADSELSWQNARSATRDAWDRVSDSQAGDAKTSSEAGVSTLNDLISTLKDGQNGFASAAETLKDLRTKAIFQELSGQRAKMAAELQFEVRKLGGSEETEGSTTAAMHRGWINLKSALGGGDKSILNEAERGEDSAVKSYEKALSANLPMGIVPLVQRQFAQIKLSHDRVRALRDSTR